MIHKQFIYGFVLVGLALIQDRQEGGNPSDEEQPSIESHVRVTSRALGPVLVPIIEAMGGLDEDRSQLASRCTSTTSRDVFGATAER